jgi:hypothetical protein
MLISSITWLSFLTRDQAAIEVFPAAINRDCSPWDGSAFTVSIPYDSGSIINISIWQSPDIKLPVTFSLPDETTRVGIAYSLPELDPLEELKGTVTFRRVEEGIPADGEFNFMTENGKNFKGKFFAE